MLLHIDGSHHRWFQDERWYDLIVILDDATSEIYHAQLVEEEGTVAVMSALREVIEHKGLFCALYSDRGSHFWLTPQAGPLTFLMMLLGLASAHLSYAQVHLNALFIVQVASTGNRTPLNPDTKYLTDAGGTYWN